MPNPKQPPRLKLRKDRDKRVWVIKDGKRTKRTGCVEGNVEGAERELAKYLSTRHEPDTSKSRPSEIKIFDVLNIYAKERAIETARPKETAQAIARLDDFWSDRTVSEIRGNTCRSFALKRGTASGARRDLETLRAACRHYKREYGMDSEPAFTMPPKSLPREGYMTRDDAARLLRACRAHPRRQHLVRLILIGLYTGTRPGAILKLQWMPNTQGGWADLERGVLYRRGKGERVAHNKRRPPCKMARKLIFYMRHWRQADQDLLHIVHYHGEPVTKINKAWRGAVRDAGLPASIVPHLLRHTRGTWLAQVGVTAGKAAESLGMTEDEYERTYRHHDPAFQSEAAEAY